MRQTVNARCRLASGRLALGYQTPNLLVYVFLQQLIAQFCKAINPKLWQPPPLPIQELQDLVNRLKSLIANKTQETNRLEKGLFALVEANVKL